jgi:hypothetical protein
MFGIIPCMGAIKTNTEETVYKATFGTGGRPARDLMLASLNSSARLVVRARGALIRSLTLGGVPVLVSAPVADSWHEPWKLDGTISMCPAGPSRGKPQHGESRLCDYSCLRPTSGTMQLRAFLRLQDLGHIKEFTLLPDGLEITDEITNLGSSTWRGSLGEHLYLPLPGVDQLVMRWLNTTGGNQLLSGRLEDGSFLAGTLSSFQPVLSAGGTVTVADFNGAAQLAIPGTGTVLVEATLLREGKDRPITTWLWHRPGTATWCFEPVAGVGFRTSGRIRNDRLSLAPGQCMKLTCRVRLVA